MVIKSHYNNISTVRNMATRALALGDIAIVTIHGKSYKYPIMDITDDGIYIDSNNETSVLVSTGGPWQVYRFTLPHTVSFEAGDTQVKVVPRRSTHTGLTPVNDANMEILLRMDLETLNSSCRTSSENAKICRNNFFWMKKLARDFPGATQFIENKDDYENAYRAFWRMNGYNTRKEKYNRSAGKINPHISNEEHGTRTNLHHLIDIGQTFYDLRYSRLAYSGFGGKDYTTKEMVETMSVMEWLIWSHPKLIKSFTEKDIVDISDLAVKTGKRGIIEVFLRNGFSLRIKADNIGAALRRGKIASVKYFLTLSVPIDGNLEYYIGADGDICDIIYQKIGRLPTEKVFHNAILEGNISKAEWILRKTGYLPVFVTREQNPKSYKDIYIDEYMDETAFVAISKWVIAHNPNVIPSEENMEDVLKYGTLNSLNIYLAKSPDNIKTYTANKACQFLDSPGALYGKDKKDEYWAKVNWMISQNPPIFPTSEGAYYICKSGKLEWLKVLLYNNIRPTSKGADQALKKRHIDMVMELMKVNPPILPSSVGLNYAIGHDMDELTVKIATMDPSIIPSENILNYSVKHKKNDIVSLFANRYPPVLPNINHILKYGQEYLREIFLQSHQGWVPDYELSDYVVIKCSYDAFMWLHQLVPFYEPDQEIIDKALIHINYRNYDTIKWALHLMPPIRPSQEAINKVIRSETKYKIEALHDLGIL
jgi:hypothetical protein